MCLRQRTDVAFLSSALTVPSVVNQETPPERLLDPAVLARIKGLRLRAERIVEGFVSGLHRSPYQGFSNEFAEHREYVPGDDLRYVDWRAYAKSDRIYLKRYEEETNLIGYLVLDVSESMAYQSAPATGESLRRKSPESRRCRSWSTPKPPPRRWRT